MGFFAKLLNLAGIEVHIGPRPPIEFRLKSYEDAGYVVNLLKDRRTVIVDDSGLGKEESLRCFDYLLGAAHGLGFEFQVIELADGVYGYGDLDSIEMWESDTYPSNIAPFPNYDRA